MRTSTLFKAASAALLATCVAASDVLDLHKDDFHSIVNPEDLILVEFFAPWCGHCKALAPHWEEAATALKEQNIKLAKVDCTAETELCSSFGIQGYPTLKVFRKGEASEYAGTRKADGIISYMKKQALPAVSPITQDNHVQFQGQDKIVIIAYLDEADSTNNGIFSSFAESHRDDYLFGLSTDPTAISSAGVTPPAVVMYKTFDEGRNDFTQSFTTEGLTTFVAEHAVPLLDEISPENFAMYAEAGIPLAYIFIPSDDANRPALIKAIEPIAREHKGKINFVWIDTNKFADHAKSLNLPEPKWPSFAIQQVQEQLKFPLPQSSEVNAQTVSDFVARFARGEIPASVKSQPVPKTQDEAVYNVVADTFDEVVMKDNKRDILIELYASWCGHCKRLAPTWETLGEKFNNSKDKILIAKMDANENDIPPSAGFRVQGFPTIKFKPAGSNVFQDYEGDRSLESFLEYIETNAVNGAKPDEIVAGSAGAGSAQVPVGGAHDEL